MSLDVARTRRAALAACSVLFCACATTALAGEDFKQNFRRGQPLHPHFGTLGPRDPACMQEEPGGLRLEVPKNGPFMPAGIVLRLKLQGDFQLDVTYTVLASDGQDAFVGVGADFPSTSVRSGSFALRLKPDAEVLGATSKKRSSAKAARPETPERVRVIRKGDVVTFQHGPVGGPLADVETRSGFEGDAQAIHFGLHSHNAPARLRVHDFAVTAEDLAGMPVARRAERVSWGWLRWTLLLPPAVWFVWRRRARARESLPASAR